MTTPSPEQAPKVPYELGEIPEDANRGWKLEVNGQEVPEVTSAVLSHAKMGLELKYGRHPAGYDVWNFHEPGGGGAIAVPYAVMSDGQILLGTVSQNRPAAGGVIRELPRGFKEPDETHDQAVVRETSEETGSEVEASRFVMLGKEKNPNTAFFNTSGEGEGLRFYGYMVHPNELEEVQDDSGTYFRYKQDLLEAAQARGDGTEKILGSRFVPLREAVQDSHDLMTSAGAGLLAAHLIGGQTLSFAGVEAPTPIAQQ